MLHQRIRNGIRLISHTRLQRPQSLIPGISKPERTVQESPILSETFSIGRIITDSYPGFNLQRIYFQIGICRVFLTGIPDNQPDRISQYHRRIIGKTMSDNFRIPFLYILPFIRIPPIDLCISPNPFRRIFNITNNLTAIFRCRQTDLLLFCRPITQNLHLRLAFDVKMW